MAYLFKTFSDIKAQVGGAVNQSIDLASVAPIVDDAFTMHLLRYLPKAWVDSLDTKYQANTLNSWEALAVKHIQKPLALLTMYEYSKVAAVQISDAGIRRVENETAKTAYKYQERQLRDYYLTAGYEALEALLFFLDKNSTQYATWLVSDEADAHLRQVVPYARTIRAQTSMQVDRWTYQCLAPLLADVQRMAFEAHMPNDFVVGFLDRCVDDTLTVAERVLRTFLQRHFAAAAIHAAQLSQVVSVIGGRVTVVEEYGESGPSNRTVPTAGAAAYNAEEWKRRNRAMQAEWIAYISANKTAFPTVYDTASGGTNTDADAWHVATTEEAAEQAIIDQQRLEQPVMLL